MFKPVFSLVLLGVGAIAAVAAAPVPTAAKFINASGAQCFRASAVSRFIPGPPGFVVVRTERNRWFQLHLSRGCPNFGLIMQVGIRPTQSDWLCEGKSDELGGLPPDNAGSCFVTDVRELPPGAVPAY